MIPGLVVRTDRILTGFVRIKRPGRPMIWDGRDLQPAVASSWRVYPIFPGSVPHPKAITMRSYCLPTLALIAIGAGLIVPGSLVRGEDKSSSPPRKVLVELYTSQGCNSCPPACELLGKLGSLGLGDDRVVALNFHVDYFNTPWVDPFSDPSFSDREQSYNQVMRRTDLYFTPMLMVDGRTPMLGSNRDQVLTAVRRAQGEAPGVALDLGVDGFGPRRSVTVKLKARTDAAVGRDLLIGVALTQDKVTTKVPSGENAGKILDEYHVVRRLDHKFTKLDRTERKTLSFPVALPAGSDPAGFRVVAFAQDRANGAVYQAEVIPWASAPQSARTAER